MKLRSGLLLALLVPIIACRGPEKPPPPESPPAITSFNVDRQNIRRGQMVTFSFTVVRAKTIELVDQFGAPVAVTFDELTGAGTAQATPARSSFYVLRAEGLGGRDAAFVQVAVEAGLQDVFLIAVPPRVKPGQRVDLVWSALGGTNVQLTAGSRMLSSQETGALADIPSATTTYTLTAQRPDGTMSTQRTTVAVIPTVDTLTATPPAAMPGETITIAWTTTGADEVVLEEASFGQLVATRSNVASGLYSFVVPSAIYDGGLADAGTDAADAGTIGDGGVVDGGIDAGPVNRYVVREGFPLKFTLTAKTTTPVQATSRTLDARVGRGPTIDVFSAPEFGTKGLPLPLSWRTRGATQVEIRANGYPVYQPLPGVNTSGSFAFGNFGAETTFTLVARDENGLTSSASRTVKSVPAPRITSFIAPMATATASMRVTVTWMTEDAAFVLLRLKNGPAFFRDDGVNSVRTGTAQFYAPQKATYVLEAWNVAGAKDVQERTIDVGAPVLFTITPELLGRGEFATYEWDVTTLAPNGIFGLMTTPPAIVTNPNGFDDLTRLSTTRTLVFDNPDDGIATIDVPNGFAFPFVTRQARHFTVSTNGFVALGDSGPLPVNADLGDVGYVGPPLLAPFWDDLELGPTGKVLWDLDESAMPRRLIISWHDVRRVGVPDSKLTFQVQIMESGRFIFGWKVLDGAGADGSDATIGAIDGVDTYQGPVSYSSSTAAELGVDKERDWFANSQETAGSRALRIRTTSTLGFTVQAGTEYVPVYGRARAFGQGDVPITEAMPAPLAVLSEAQWVELYNPASTELEVSGLRLESASALSNPFILPADTFISPRGYLVVGQSTDPSLNGDAGVKLAWGAGLVPLAVPDSVRLVVPTPLGDGGVVVVGSLGWGGFNSFLADGGRAPDGGVDVGSSVTTPENVLVRAGSAPFTCTQSRSFGPPTQYGTPGALNEQCFDYELTEIAVAIDDISSSGRALFPTSGWDDDVVNVTLPSFPYFGTTVTTATVSSNGWLSTVLTTSTSLTNKTVPSGTAPVGTIGVLWDDMDQAVVPGSNVYFLRRADHTVISWHHVTRYMSNTTPSDDLTFQMKLFDTGVIEMHYGQLTAAPASSLFGNGDGATRWIENPSGTHALAISVNQPTVRPDTAFRFTPRQVTP